MRSAAASNLPGAPSDWPALSASSLLGLAPGKQSKAAGASLPPVTVAGHDRAMVPWHPDSPVFWLAIFAGATALGIFGASIDVRAFRKHARASVGT